MFKLNGREYRKLKLINYATKLEVLDGEATGRTKAYGWPLIRDPEGTIINLALEFAGTWDANSGESELVHLYNTCYSMGTQEFANVEFLSPIGQAISQRMYLVMSEIRNKLITRDNKVYTDSIKVAFIAEKGS